MEPRERIEPKKPLTPEEIAKIYQECAETRAMPEWKTDDQEKPIGWEKISIDADRG